MIISESNDSDKVPAEMIRRRMRVIQNHLTPRAPDRATNNELSEWNNGTPAKGIRWSNPVDRSGDIAG